MLIKFKRHPIPTLFQWEELKQYPQVHYSTLILHFKQNRWAIPKCQNASFILEQRNYSYEEFIIDEETGQKTTVDKVTGKMRTKHTIDGKKLFVPNETINTKVVN